MTFFPKLSIIITTFNSSNVILNCLNKIDLNLYNVFVVDNNSSDNTVKIIEENFFDKITIIKNSKNLGYGRGNNCALRLVESEFAMILNPDAFIFSNSISLILQTLEQNPEIAICAPLLLKKYPFDAQDFEQEIQVVKQNLRSQENGFVSVKYVIGACLVLRMNFFQKIGFYDEEIFLYYEDDEICHRVIANNKICAINTEAFAYHIGQGSCGKNYRNLYRRFWHRSWSKFHWKEKQKGLANAYFSASKLVILYGLQSLFYIFIWKPEKIIAKTASIAGGTAYLFRLKAFDKNDNPRGNIKLF
ncbi:MAG: glycosyltransferase family 2 protein [Alphaproteobacteria bacterium]|nr:glycosyltransferase family 2 protein [Alphaproteobacteria bacterium]